MLLKETLFHEETHVHLPVEEVADAHSDGERLFEEGTRKRSLQIVQRFDDLCVFCISTTDERVFHTEREVLRQHKVVVEHRKELRIVEVTRGGGGFHLEEMLGEAERPRGAEEIELGRERHHEFDEVKRLVDIAHFCDLLVPRDGGTPPEMTVLVVVVGCHDLQPFPDGGESQIVVHTGSKVGVTALKEETVSVGHVVGELSVVRSHGFDRVCRHELHGVFSFSEGSGERQRGEEIVVGR